MEENWGPAFRGHEKGMNRRQVLLSVDTWRLWNWPLWALTCLSLERGVDTSVESP